MSEAATGGGLGGMLCLGDKGRWQERLGFLGIFIDICLAVTGCVLTLPST